MRRINRTAQAGYALILMVLLLMGVGGVVIAGFTQQAKQDAEHQLYLHNQRVLEKAKQALLLYAYNYAHISNNVQGPGRLPCPDTDNDGDQNTAFGDCIVIGRLPWAEPELNLYDIRDASGQRLWYAVSQNFGAVVSGGNIINSDTDGTLTIRDQSGKFIHNGSIAPAVDGRANGVAAVIIAPGAITERNGVVQDRSVGNGDDPFDYTELDDTDKDTDPGIISPVNYLDRFFAIEDNATLDQGGTDGFILGPVDDLAAGSIRVNDQIVVITAAEVVAMAEKAALKAYRDAILDYDQRIDADVGAGDHYPWLFNYAVNNYGGGYPELDDYPSDPSFATELATYLGNYGRVPSPYTRYFTETDGRPIESHIGVNMSLNYPAATPVAFNPTLPSGADTPSVVFDGTGQVTGFASTDPLTFVQFQDVDPDVFSTNDGRLIATVVTNETISASPLFFWDEKPIGDGWVLCGGGANEASDCNRDSAGVNVPQGPNDTPSQVLRVQADLELQPAPVTSATISFSNINPDTITDTAAGLGAFSDGDLVRIEGSASNAGFYLVASATAGTLTLDLTETLNNELAGATVTVSRVIQFVTDYDALPVSSVLNAADINRHAVIEGTFAGANVEASSLPVSVSYIYDSNYDTSFDPVASGTIALADLLATGSLGLTMRFYPELPDWVFEDGWHDAIQLAYANDYRPDVATGPCTPGGSGDCLNVANLAGTNDNKISILILGGEHDWNDDGAAGLTDDTGDIFDLENEDLDPQFDAARAGGNDKVMVIEEL